LNATRLQSGARLVDFLEASYHDLLDLDFVALKRTASASKQVP